MDTAATSQAGKSAPALSRTAKQYGIAMRHSQHVRLLKLALPVAAFVLIAGFVVVSWIGTKVPEGVSVESAGIADGKIVMRNPVVTGENAEGMPYTLKALKAIQDITTPDRIVLEDIEADMPVSAATSAKLRASRGVYDRAAQTMKLTEPFSVTTSDGMTAQIRSADIDIAAGTVVANDPVTVQTGGASIVANSMQILDKGKTIVFENRVRMTVDPSAVPNGDATGKTPVGKVPTDDKAGE